jgi:rsbT co-antagonist protein RsbR
LVSAVTSGMFSTRLPELPETEAFRELYGRLNETTALLASAHRRVEQCHFDILEADASIQEQRDELRELSTPVIEVYSGVICLPVIGVMDSTRCATMTEALLSAVSTRTARLAILDVTGIEVIETQTLDHFARMARAVQLLGSECVISGISSAMAQSIVVAGIDLGNIPTFGTMRDALATYLLRRNGRSLVVGRR